MINKISAAAVSLAFCATGALAQDFSGAVTLGYSHTKQSDLEVSLNGLTLDGRADFALGNGLTFGARYNSFSLDVAGFDLDINGSLIGLDVKYAISDAFSAGVFLEQAEIGGELGGVKVSSLAASKTVGIEGHYTSGNLEFGAFYATSTPGGLAAMLLAGTDMSHFGLSAQYNASAAFTVGGSFMRTTVEAPGGGMSFDLDYVGLAAVYSVNDSTSLFGGWSKTSQGDLDIALSTLAVGGAYDLSERAGMPLIASLELARTTLDIAGGGFEPTVESIRLGLTMPLGRGSVKAPLNSTADAILNPSHTVISQTFMNF
ncbi:hypothetical protein Q9295_15245 [Xinfangfangia sp. CPCC 101601]|uniref:Porin n=1 Tax=Pseudogemmobacter lacusdianii TaxID=3069608 RepID=A0ABU0W164_9RHOB|nr:hypothetical protein [Xinfangfangia sp. CPCC 101601]MDQ2067731.1 hypothetical protein [Xinfangfangia sp. CPCC 101601]